MKSWADLFEDEETGSVLFEFMWLVMHNGQMGPRLTGEGSLSPTSHFFPQNGLWGFSSGLVYL